MKYLVNLVLFLLVTLLFNCLFPVTVSAEKLVNPQSKRADCLWDVCSIDTMKLSRDKARQELYHPEFDKKIAEQIAQIKNTGANFVSIGTPYDKEFLPYLRRWVKAAREQDLNVYFRGNWSEWEGWFEYPKSMTPEEHLQRTTQFIVSQPDLFEDGDIFDPCPECENAGFWPQNDKNSDYQQFIQKQQTVIQEAFQKISKKVQVRQSIIGGRAKDVLDQTTFDKLGNLIFIDHYVSKPKVMTAFVDYFTSLNTKVVVSEFGAPIPDLNGNMTEKQQADFVRNILEALYLKNEAVLGLNYWVLSHGTTSLVEESGREKNSYLVLQEYFSPQIVEGKVVDELEKPLSGVPITTKDGLKVLTDQNGFYRLKYPVRSQELKIEADKYTSQTASIAKGEKGSITTQNFILKPEDPSLFYSLKLWWKNQGGFGF